jgi:exonuclease SbcC
MRENGEWSEKLRLFLDITKDMNQLEKHIEKSKSELTAERNSISQQVTELENIVKELPRWAEEIKRLQAAIADLSRQEEELNKHKQLVIEADADIKNLASSNSSIEIEMKGLKEKLEMLQEETVRCPLCETELGMEGKQRLDENYKQQVKEKAETHKRNQEEIQQKRKAQQVLRNEIAARDKNIKNESSSKQKELAITSGKVQRVEEARGQLQEKVKRREELDHLLTREIFAIPERKVLMELSAKYQGVGYDRALHSKARESLKEYVRYEGLKKSLDEARANLAQEKALFSRAEGLIAEKNLTREGKNTLRSLLVRELEELPLVTRQWQQNKENLSGLSRERETAREKSGDLRGRLSYLEQLQKEKKKDEIDLRRLAEEEKIYEELARYFGKKGIQAMLIETALPEIEEEANSLLGRLTENRLSLKIETQRARRGGAGAEETLDIKIGDELGTRDYALFSGGEAFRINFALRLALSRLLARRAGAPLPTLIIDEGFGTQDREGRERLVEAIDSIREDFEKIIVITHIEELKESFPVRIEVIKTSEGSTFRIS